jgi:hypothetical protein
MDRENEVARSEEHGKKRQADNKAIQRNSLSLLLHLSSSQSPISVIFAKKAASAYHKREQFATQNFNVL